MMIMNRKEWLERQLVDWTGKGWITAEGADNIRQSYGRTENSGIASVLYMILAVVALSFAGIAVIWGAAYVWYHIPVALRLGCAVLILLLAQCGAALAVFQNRQGTWAGEAVALAHCVAVFAALALVKQTFYTGEDMSAYIIGGAVLCLPSAYLLRSVGMVLVYCLSVLAWVSLRGPFASPGDAALFWLFLALPLPMYYVFSIRKDELRLSVFSWAVTISVFLSFGSSMRHAAYVPFLLSSALAAVIMLAGYSIDMQKSWGVPFRWFGRFAVAVSLLISCVPAVWYGVADIQEFYWPTLSMMVLLFLAIVALLAKGVKKRFWGPVIYSFVPFILLGETMLVRSGLYSSVPLIISTAYMIFLGFYEIMQGIRGRAPLHVRFGAVILVSVVAVVIFGAAFSPLVPLVAIIVAALAALWHNRAEKKRRAAEQRSARRMQVKPTATLRSPSADFADTAAPKADKKDEPMPKWMQRMDLDISAADDIRPAGTVIPKETPRSPFVPPVFHSPDEMALPSMTAIGDEKKRSAKVQEKEKQFSSSPWKTAAPAKREKQFTRSPWAKEGETKK